MGSQDRRSVCLLDRESIERHWRADLSSENKDIVPMTSDERFNDGSTETACSTSDGNDRKIGHYVYTLGSGCWAKGVCMAC